MIWVKKKLPDHFKHSQIFHNTVQNQTNRESNCLLEITIEVQELIKMTQHYSSVADPDSEKVSSGSRFNQKVGPGIRIQSEHQFKSSL